ncbi:MAG: flagellar basal body-associated FliL family protein [Planctomycetes bacterium]|nr:flagellar basal body-associated FliL family protein [Planctomycetota bacterium]
MAEEENVEQASAAEAAQAPMFSSKGWIIVILIVVIEAVFFGILLFSRNTDPADSTITGAERKLQPANLLNKYTVAFEGLPFSIQSMTRTETLSMDIEIILGLTVEEQARANAQLPEPPVMEQYKLAVMSLKPHILDKLRNIINNMSTQQINKPEGEAIIKEDLRAYINERLRGLEFEGEEGKAGKERVIEVVITQIVMS